MAYRTVSEVRFTERFLGLTREEQDVEQVAAMEIVARNGGIMESILVVPEDRVAITVVDYPDERASVKAHFQIMERRAYELTSRRCYPLDEWMTIAEEARSESVVTV